MKRHFLTPVGLLILVAIFISPACSPGVTLPQQGVQPTVTITPEPASTLPRPTRVVPSRAVPTDTSQPAAGSASTGCTETGAQPNSNYLGDSDSRGGTDAVTY